MAQITHDCPHCAAQRCAMPLQGQGYGRRENYLFCVCPIFAKPVVFQFANAQQAQIAIVIGDPQFTPERIGLRLVDFWPKPPNPNRIDHLPDAVAKAFAAAERNFPLAGMEEAAGGSYGRAIDLAIKLIDPTLKGTLHARIEALAKAHRLTPDLAAWAHEIRELRNEALHEVESMERGDLAAIRGLTEMVLRYLFDLPGMLAERKAQSKAA